MHRHFVTQADSLLIVCRITIWRLGSVRIIASELRWLG
jgi:hypothetical protein